MSGLVVCLALAAQSHVGIPPAATAPDLIVFRSDRDAADGDIYRMDHQGAHIQRLTAARGIERDIALNVQGTQIAFFREVGYGLGIKGIYTVGANGTGERLLPRMTDCGSITFSPDGSHLAFVNVDPALGTQNDIFIMASDGSRLARFTNRAFANMTGLAWSRDGSTLAFMRYQPTPAIFYVPTDGGAAVKVALGDEPGFSLAGDKLIYSRNLNGLKQVYSSDLQGRNEHQLMFGYDIGRVVFDTNGTGLVFSALRPKAQVFLMDPNQRTINLSNNRFSDSAPVVPRS